MTSRARDVGWATLNVLFNIALPATWLMLVSREVAWGAVAEFGVGISFPFAFATANALRMRKLSVVSVIAIASISLTAVVGFWAQERIWFAVKGGVMPGLIALTIVCFRPRITAELSAFVLGGPFVNGLEMRARLRRDAETSARFGLIMASCTRWFILHFLFNAAINSSANWFLVTAKPGTELFNEQYGELLMRNVYLVGLPCALSIGAIVTVTALRVGRLTGLTLREMLRNPFGAPSNRP